MVPLFVFGVRISIEWWRLIFLRVAVRVVRVEILFLISLRRTAVGIYALRLLQLKSSGRLSPRAVLALGCCGGFENS